MAGCKSRGVFVSLALAFCMLSFVVEGREHMVGGKSDAWKIPSSESETLNKWAEASRFHTGDYLVWKYDAKKDSVLEVTREAYLSCNTTNPISEHKDGETRVKLQHSGAFYFISGAEGHCDKGEKMIVVVMAHRKHHLGASPSPSPSPSPSSGLPLEGPAVAPTSAASESNLGFFLPVVILGFAAGIFAM